MQRGGTFNITSVFFWSDVPLNQNKPAKTRLVPPYHTVALQQSQYYIETMLFQINLKLIV